MCARTFSDKRYYSQHFKYNPPCNSARREGLAFELSPPQQRALLSGEQEEEPEELSTAPAVPNNDAQAEGSNVSMEADHDQTADSGEEQVPDGIMLGDDDDDVSAISTPEVPSHVPIAYHFGSRDDNSSISSGTHMEVDQSNSDDESSQMVEVVDDPEDIIQKMHCKFKEYCDNALHNFVDLTPDRKAACQLLKLLKDKHCPGGLYEDIWKWHNENIDAREAPDRFQLMKYLGKRYNTQEAKPFTKKMELPFSKARINLVLHDARAQLISLLTDPRIGAEHYLFHDDNPFAPPPKEFEFIDDINTSMSYRKTYEALVEGKDAHPYTDSGRRKVLLPVIFYMDGAVTGQFANLPIEQLKFTIGILNNKARGKESFWRTLGCVKNFIAEETKAKNLIMNSGHVDLNNYLSDSDASEVEEDVEEIAGQLGAVGLEDTDEEDEEGEEFKEKEVPACNAQDLHYMMEAMLQSYKELQVSGFDWDLSYKGKSYQLHFELYVAFIKGDTVEHDKHCGSYNSRNKGVKQLCRYCTVPNDETDDAYCDYERKTQEMMQALVQDLKSEELKELSQHLIKNCWYPIRFGLHRPELGVHGACPLELLHWMLLGKYKYLRIAFFEQLGPDSAVAQEINAMARTMGKFLKRQSDRDLPRTHFSRGIIKGKLMAHEMRGVMLVLLATLRSTAGRELLTKESRGKGRKNLGEEYYIKDWMMLLETYLEFDAWLGKEDPYSVSVVKRLSWKVRELMEMEKAVAKRAAGMKYKIFNFHGGIHIPQDILDLGAPRCVNSASNEMHHKGSKGAAKLTQKIPDKFDYQIELRLHEQFGLDLADQEMKGKVTWDYYRKVEEEELVLEEIVPFLTGTKSLMFRPQAGEDTYQFKVCSKMKAKSKFKFGPDLDRYLIDLLLNLPEETQCLKIYTEHHRHGQIFRGSPYYRGGPWRDWAMFDIAMDDDSSASSSENSSGRVEQYPCQIHCFLDLREVKRGMCEYEPDMYAVVECAEMIVNDKEVNRSELFLPYQKELRNQRNNDGITHKRKFYTLSVESIAATACMIPDLGNRKKNCYLRLLPRDQWASLFEDWLEQPHTRQFQNEENNN